MTAPIHTTFIESTTMLIRHFLLTENEIIYLLQMPAESEESMRFVDRLRLDWEKKNNKFRVLDPGRWQGLLAYQHREGQVVDDEDTQMIRDKYVSSDKIEEIIQNRKNPRGISQKKQGM